MRYLTDRFGRKKLFMITLVAVFFAVDAEQKSLEDIAEPLSAEAAN